MADRSEMKNSELSMPAAQDEVGRGNPPKHSRFKKGVSGNPKGRPKGRLNFATVFERALREVVIINENGRRKKVSKLEAAFKQVVNKATLGDLSALKALCTLNRFISELPVSPRSNNKNFREADQRIIERILQRFDPSKEEGK